MSRVLISGHFEAGIRRRLHGSSAAPHGLELQKLSVGILTRIVDAVQDQLGLMLELAESGDRMICRLNGLERTRPLSW